MVKKMSLDRLDNKMRESASIIGGVRGNKTLFEGAARVTYVQGKKSRNSRCTLEVEFDPRGRDLHARRRDDAATAMPLRR